MKKLSILTLLLTAAFLSACSNPFDPGSSPTPTAPPVPTAAPAPAGPAATTYVSLNYDETNGDPLTPGQSKLIALYLREAQAAGSTQAAMETAVTAIQKEASNAKATTVEGKTLNLPRNVAWFVWCANATGADFPTDTSDVFDRLAQGPARVWIQVPFASGVPLPNKNTFANCNGRNGTFWAVAVR